MRPETGPMQFRDDWPGVFIRGDNALGYAIALDVILSTIEFGGIGRAQLTGLMKTLRGCDATIHPDVQRAVLVGEDNPMTQPNGNDQSKSSSSPSSPVSVPPEQAGAPHIACPVCGEGEYRAVEIPTETVCPGCFAGDPRIRLCRRHASEGEDAKRWESISLVLSNASLSDLSKLIAIGSVLKSREALSDADVARTMELAARYGWEWQEQAVAGAAPTASDFGDDASREAAKRMSVRGPSPINLEQIKALARTHRMPRDPFAEQLAEAIFQLVAVIETPTSHRCSGCGHCWHGGSAKPDEWTGAELCGDCWRLAQPVLHTPDAGAGAAPTAQTHRCNGCGHRWDGPLKGAELCGDCWRKGQSVILGYDVERPPACRNCGCPGMDHPSGSPTPEEYCACGKCPGYAPWPRGEVPPSSQWGDIHSV